MSDWKPGRLLEKFGLLALCLVLAFQVIVPLPVKADDEVEDENFKAVFNHQTKPVTGEPRVEALAAIVMDSESGRVLYARNAAVRRSIASTTKIMTAIVALENGSLNHQITISKKAANTWGSDIGLKQGQIFTLEELLYGLMLKSGNDAAVAIAEHIGGSVEGFAAMMNRKARELGAADTAFVTPHGLDADGHYSTAYDMALITRYALDNPTFARIVSTDTIRIHTKVLHNTNELLGNYPGTDGVKTGYTGKAGRCLVASATRDGMHLISVVLGCSTRSKRAESSRLILDYAFKNYKPYTLLTRDRQFEPVLVCKGIKPSVRIKAEKEVVLPMREDEIAALEERVHLPEQFEAPVYAGTDAGQVDFLVNGEPIAQVDLKALEDVRRKNFSDYMGRILKTWGKMMKEGIFAEP